MSNQCEHPDCDEEGELFGAPNMKEICACEEHAEWALEKSKITPIPRPKVSQKDDYEVMMLQVIDLYSAGIGVELISCSANLFYALGQAIGSGRIQGRIIDNSILKNSIFTSPNDSRDSFAMAMPTGSYVQVVLSQSQREPFLFSLNTKQRNPSPVFSWRP